MQILTSILLLTTIFITGCGALEQKTYPDDKSITSGMFNNTDKNITSKKLDTTINTQLTENTAPSTPDNNLFPTRGSIYFVNAIHTQDTQALDAIAQMLENNSNVTRIIRINLPLMPSLNEIRLMSAKNGARYALVINEYSNAYQYHNVWTIPSVLGLGIPYFFLDTQTILYLSKIEATVIDVENNVLLLNESTDASAEGKSTVSESGATHHKLKQDAMSTGLNNLQEIIAKKL